MGHNLLILRPENNQVETAPQPASLFEPKSPILAMEGLLTNKRLPNAGTSLLAYTHVASITTTIGCTGKTANNGQLNKELGLNPIMPA